MTPEQAAEPEINSTEPVRFIDNGVIRVGFDMAKGGGISHLYMVDKSAPHQGVNLGNNYDHGRLIQQSYYGDPDGSVWHMTTEERPWRWNAVQGGDYKGSAARVDKVKQTKTTFQATTTPRHWVTAGLLEDTKMTQTVVLEKDVPVARLHYTMEYTGKVSHKLYDQELPAMFFWVRLRRLVTYTGTSPFKDQPVKTIEPPIRPEPVPDHIEATEHWAAYVDESGWGIGVYFPHATQLGYYVVNNEQNPEPSNCAYMAPIKQLSITSPFKFEYDAYFIVGKVEDIRKKVYALHNK